MHRSGPLVELPLEQFFHPPPASVKPIKASKRPHSPGGPTPFSPAKRRILNEEGIFSPEKSCKTPLPRRNPFASPARFSKVLAGPASPARVLDFGLPKNSGGDPQKRHSSSFNVNDAGPYQTPSSSRTEALAPSPELKPRATRRAESPSHEDPFDFDSLPSPSTSPLSTSFTLVPREMPLQTDPRSIHYPGFAIYQDPHIVVYTPETKDESSQDEMNVGVQVCKENVAPRRKIRKAVTEPKVSSKMDISPTGTSLKKSYSALDTPRMSTPRSSYGGMMEMRSSSLTPHISRGMRQLMKDELELGEGHSDNYDY